MDSITSQEPKSKAETLLQQFYAKTAQIIVQSRIAVDTNGKLNKWFNLELQEYDPLKEEIKFWKGQLAATLQAPPLIIDILLDISNLQISQHLILTNSSTGRKHRIRPEDLMGTDPTGKPIRKEKILLESWQLSFSPEIIDQPAELPIVYKKCIVFFRSLYSFVRLIPSYKLNKKVSPNTVPLQMSYRVGTSRVFSPFDAGLGTSWILILDQLHSNKDMRLGLAESSFESLQTPLGIFHLHVTYRLDCEFEVDTLHVKLDDLEPQFFNIEEIKRRASRSSQKSSQGSSVNYSDRDSLSRLNRPSPSEIGKSRVGSIPKPREGMTIPNRRIKDVPFGRNSLVGNSPETQFRVGTAPVSKGLAFDQRSLHSPNFIAFTPPAFNTAPDWLADFSREPPPFSQSSLPDSTKFVLNKSELLSASPPFAFIKEEDINKSLQLVRRPSYVFPSSPPVVLSTPPNNILFTPSSSLKNIRNNRGSPETLFTFSDKPQQPTNIELFLSNIEQARNLKVANEADNSRQSLIIGSKIENSTHIHNALSRFKDLQKANSEFADSITLALDVKQGAPQSEPKIEEKKASIREWNARHSDDRNIPVRTRQRSLTSDWAPTKEIPRDETLSRSESFQHNLAYDDDELVFNMSELDL